VSCRRVGVAVAAVLLAGAAPALAQTAAQGVDFSAVAGTPVTTTVATFAGDRGVQYSAIIDWGDGGRGSGTVTELTGCPDQLCFAVTGTHTYAAAGSYLVLVEIEGATRTRATATATVSAPGPQPGGPTARIAIAQPSVRPGQPAVFDASGSSGDIKLFAFDLNGNGTYETKTASPIGTVLHTVPGAKQVGVQVVGATGQTAGAVLQFDVAGTPTKPPAGQKPLAKGTVVGSVGTAGVDAVLKNYTCPTMVQVGVAEATISQEPTFPPTPGEPCFERVTAPAKPGDAYAPGDYPRFVAGKAHVLLNGLDINTRPNPNAANNRLVILEKKQAITQEHPGWQQVVLRLHQPGIGGITSKQFTFGTWNVASLGTVGTFPIEDFFNPTLMGLPVVAKDTPIEFIAGYRAQLKVFVAPPFDLSLLGPKNSPTGQSPLTLLADNTDGLQVEGSIVASGGKYHLDLPLGIFHLVGTLSYSKQGSSNVWSGDVNLRIPGTPIDNIDGTIVFKDGSFEHAHVAMPFERPGLGPIGCCIYLVGLEGDLTPHSIQGSATFAAGPDLIGDFRVAEATATVSLQYSPFVLAFIAKPLRIAKWEVGATTQVMVTPSKFFTYAFWDGGLGPVSWKLNVEAMVGSPWYVAGGGTACADVWPFEGCANVHGAAGPDGVTVCAGISIGVADIEGGIRVPWNPLSITDYGTYTGCSFSLVKAKVSATRAAAIRAAAGAYPVRVPRGLRAALFVIEGAGGKPQVALRGPGGTAITTPAPGASTTRGPSWVAVRGGNGNSVHVIVARPAAGRWTARELAGSPAVRSIGLAEALPRRLASGRVSGRGRTRTLHYRTAQAPGTRVTFVERGGDPAAQDPGQRVEQTIGRAKARKGSIRFTPGEAKVRRRRIEAVVESQGAVIRTELIARFTAPRFRLPAAPRVTVKRSGRAAVARWRAVAGADAYQVFVNRSDGGTSYRRLPARGRSVRIGGITALTAADVEVRAVSPAGYIGRPGRGRLRAAAPFRVARRQPLAAVLRAGGFDARCIAAGDGRCEVTVVKGRRVIARGSKRLRHGQPGRVSVELTRAGTSALLAARRSRRAVTATLVPALPGVGVPTVRVRFR
jgi:hypothetical protein